MRRTEDERGSRWSAQLRVLERATGIVVVRDSSTWVIGVDDLSASAWLADELVLPPTAEPASPDRARDLRRAIAGIRAARGLDASIAKGLPALRRWRTTDIASLVDDAERFADRLDAALERAGGAHDPLTPQPGLVDGSALDGLDPESLPPEIRRIAPAVLRSPAIERDMRRAVRLVGHPDARIARRWLGTARARWWAHGDVLQLLDSAAHDIASGSIDRDQLADYVRNVARSVGTTVSRRDAASLDAGAALELLGRIHDQSRRHDADREEALWLLIATPGAEWSIGGEPSKDGLVSIARVVRRYDGRDREAIAKRVPVHLRRGVAPGWWVADLPVSDAIAVLDRWPIPTPTEPWSVRALRRYLRLLDSIGGHQKEWLRERWVAELVSSDLANNAFGVFLAAKRLDTQAMDAGMGLLALLGRSSPQVSTVLQAWGRPRLERPHPELAEIADVTGLSHAELVEYLHYRRLAGDGEELPRDLRRSRAETGLESQVQAIDRMLAEPDLAEDRRQALTRQRDRLEGRIAGSDAGRIPAKRWRNQIRRASSIYSVSSLRKQLEGAAAASLGFELPEDLEISLLVEVLLLAADTNVDQSLLRRFLRGGFLPGAMEGWPENQAWIASASAAFDVGAWLAGFDRHVVVGDVNVRYSTESDPVRAVHMGSWFDTCLAIAGGMNRASALTNAIESNRHVVYGGDPAGRIVARKLLAVSATNQLLGYRTYAAEHTDVHAANLDDICADFAAGCGLALADQGEPKSLTGAFWYDDGTAPWTMRPDAATAGPNSRTWGWSESREQGSGFLTQAWARGEMTAEALAATLASVENPLLVGGAWLDGRIDDLRPIALQLIGSGWDWVLVGLTDPDALAVALETCRPLRDSWDTRLDKAAPSQRLIATAIRRGFEVGPLFLGQIGPSAVEAYLRRNPDSCDARQLRHQGVSERALVRFIDDNCGYWDSWYRERERAASMSTRSIREMARGVDDRSVAACIELAIRGDRRSAAIVTTVAERTRDPDACMAAAVFGVDVAPEPSGDDPRALRRPHEFGWIAATRFPATWPALAEQMTDAQHSLAAAVDEAWAGSLAGLRSIAAVDAQVLDNELVLDLLHTRLRSREAPDRAGALELLLAAYSANPGVQDGRLADLLYLGISHEIRRSSCDAETIARITEALRATRPNSIWNDRRYSPLACIAALLVPLLSAPDALHLLTDLAACAGDDTDVWTDESERYHARPFEYLIVARVLADDTAAATLSTLTPRSLLAGLRALALFQTPERFAELATPVLRSCTDAQLSSMITAAVQPLRAVPSPAQLAVLRAGAERPSLRDEVTQVVREHLGPRSGEPAEQDEAGQNDEIRRDWLRTALDLSEEPSGADPC